MKSFEKFFESPEEGKRTLQQRFLRIVNGEEIEAPITIPSQALHNTLHENRTMDSRKDAVRYEESRNSIFESFGIENDEGHVFIKNQSEGTMNLKQRAFRAFVVLIDKKYTNPDTGLHESFYGEGRTAHNELLRESISLAQRYGIPDLSFGAYVKETEEHEAEKERGEDSPQPRWLFFKGFLVANEDELNQLPFSDRGEILRSFALRKSGLEDHTIKDEEGALEADESMKWFLTGSNLPSPEPKPES